MQAEKNIIYIYEDDGVSRISLTQTTCTLKEILPNNYHVCRINAKCIISTNWTKNAALLIMPGGADIPYAKKLNGKGNTRIKNYVDNGGSYLGICAGAYYGSSYIEFDKGTNLEVSERRELAFFGGSTIGPILAKYDHKSNSGTRAAKIKLELEQVKEASIYYNGGGYFKDATTYKDVVVLGYYENHLPAVIHILFGKGKVVLSGVHFEYNPFLLNTYDPHLQKIALDLRCSNIMRIKLVEAILKTFGIFCKKNEWDNKYKEIN
jgi:biotin--protein ligase